MPIPDGARDLPDWTRDAARYERISEARRAVVRERLAVTLVATRWRRARWIELGGMVREFDLSPSFLPNGGRRGSTEQENPRSHRFDPRFPRDR